MRGGLMQTEMMTDQWHDVKEGTFPGRLDGTTFNDDGTFRILAEAKSTEKKKE